MPDQRSPMISELTLEEMQDIHMRRADPRRSLFLAGIAGAADAPGPCRTEPEPGSN